MLLTDPLTSSEDVSELSPSGPYRAVKQLGLVLLCAAWIVLGLFGHDPWKPEDATTFGSAYDMLMSGDWSLPKLAGTPLPDRAPLFYAFSAVTASMFKPWLPLHDGARIAIGLCLGCLLWLLAATAREIYGRPFRWPAALLFLGCVGLWDRAHQLSPDIGLLVAYALGLYSLALSLRRPLVGGAGVGVALGIGTLCKAFAGVLPLAVTALLLALFPRWRNRRHALTLVTAAAVALPVILVWPLALRIHDPAMDITWETVSGLSRFFGLVQGSPPVEPFYYVKNLPWFAWPALPLAVWTLGIRARGFNGGYATAGIELPLTMTLVLVVLLSAGAEPRAILALPMLLPLSLLGAAEVDTLKRGYSGALDWFGILTFGLLGALIWTLWLESALHGLPEPVAHIFRDTQPGYRAPMEVLPLAVSIFLTLLWFALVRPARRSNRRAILNWAAGMTLVWGLYMTIWLPYLDSRRSYRPVAESLAAYLPHDTCVASQNLGEPQRALIEYFIGVITVRNEVVPGNDCGALLLQVGREDSDVPPDSAWTKVWEGHRRGDDTERFVLFRRSIS